MKPTPTLTIRRATADDAAGLTRIAKAAKAHWGYPDLWLREWDAVLTLSPAFVTSHPTYLADTASGAIGFHGLVCSGIIATLEHLWVLPEWMGCGVGRALFRHAEETAAAGGMDRLQIVSDPHALGFYHRLGAVRIGWDVSVVAHVSRQLPRLEKRLSVREVQG